jgi:hypothetical protein
MARGFDWSAVKKGLRRSFESNDSFITGHQVKRIRSLHDGRKVPDWSTNDEAVRNLLLRSFPKLAINELQRKRAGRWMRVIQLYFRSKKSRRETADEMGESENVVRMLVRSIKLAQKGWRTNGTGKRTRNTGVTPTPHLSESE